MSLTNCSRRRISTLRCQTNRSIVRHLQHNAAQPTGSTSTPSKTKVESHRTLPPAKMRALVSLYHQAGSWVTPENLLQKIDKAFASETAHHGLSLPSQEGIGWQDLVSEAQQMKIQPKMAQLEADPSFGKLGHSYRTLSKREEQMIEALYGVEVMSNSVLPGLEVLQEMQEGLRSHSEEDKKGEEGEDVSDLLKRE